MAFPLLIPLLGMGAGALFNKKDPLKGALMGGALGLGGAALAPGLLGAGTAAGTAATGAAEGLLGAGGATAGIVPGATAASELAAAEGLNAAGYLAPEMGGMVAEQAAAPVVDMGTQAGMFDTMNYQSGGLLGKAKGAFDTANKIAKPVGMAMQMGQQMAGQEQPMQAPPPQMPQGRQDLAGLLQYGQQQQQYDAQEAERRKQLMQMYAGNIGRI